MQLSAIDYLPPPSFKDFSCTVLTFFIYLQPRVNPSQCRTQETYHFFLHVTITSFTSHLHALCFDPFHAIPVSLRTLFNLVFLIFHLRMASAYFSLRLLILSVFWLKEHVTTLHISIQLVPDVKLTLLVCLLNLFTPYLNHI